MEVSPRIITKAIKSLKLLLKPYLSELHGQAHHVERAKDFRGLENFDSTNNWGLEEGKLCIISDVSLCFLCNNYFVEM